MNEEFDDRLKARISEAFDNYEDGSAQEGWLLLREKYPEKEKRRPVLWLWWGSVAAILLLALGIGLWVNMGSRTGGNVVKHPVPVHQKVMDSAVADQRQHHGDSIRTKQNIGPVGAESNRAQIAKAQSKVSAQLVAKVKSQVTSQQNLAIAGEFIAKKAHKALRRSAKQGQMDDDKQPATLIAKAYQTVAKTDGQITINGAPDKPVGSAMLSTDSLNAKAKPDTSTKKAIAAVKKPELKKPSFSAQTLPETKVEKKPEKRVKFGVYAATYFNYAKGSDNEFNVGAGFSTEVRLVGHLKLVTGLAVTQNSLNYKSTAPQTAINYLAYSLAADPGLTASSPTTGVSSSPLAVKNYQASLVGLDIPVNLKYQFTDNDTYISAGFSSGTYVNETYQFVYSYTAAGTSQNTKTQNNFSSFDFARTLNLSIGKGVSLGSKNRLIVEPFLKYPLNGLGSQQIKFGSGGINLRFNFLPTKK